VPEEDYGKFYSGDCYIVLYAYNNGGKDCYLLYYWLVINNPQICNYTCNKMMSLGLNQFITDD
jgi:hypothetical protein